MRLLYVLPDGRKERLQLGTGTFPDEFFYGYCHLSQRKGWETTLLTRSFPSRLGLLLQKLTHWVTHLSPDFSNWKNLDGVLLESYDVIVSTSEPVLLMLALRKKTVGDMAKMVLILMGAEKRISRSRMPSLTRSILRWLCARIGAVVVIGEGERGYLLQEKFVPPDALHLIQFGVDSHFWMPDETVQSEGFILALGNDDGRDYESLLSAIGNHPLRLHTARPLQAHKLPSNVNLTRGNWSGLELTDEDIRGLYQKSLFVVTPLLESTQPQGQSVTLQAMACGKAVIVTKTRGLWSKDLMRHMDNCYLVPPGDVQALSRAITTLMADPELCHRMGKAARATVEQSFSSTRMADRIGEIMERVHERQLVV